MVNRRIKLLFSVKRPILACGADLKGAFAFAEGNEAFLVDGFGDLGDPDHLERYDKTIKNFLKKSDAHPKAIACDLHPDYFSSRFAEHYTLNTKRYTLFKVQHHEAHIASAILDNNIKGDCIGVAFDGTGFGSDGNIWGGEFFVGGLNKFNRVAHLEYIPMPGGDAAIKEPWRMAVSYLYRAFGKKLLTSRLGRSIKVLSRLNLRVLKAMIDKRINSPLTSSVGRLFDAVGCLVLGKDIVVKEAELPMELESILADEDCGSYKFKIQKSEEGLIVNTSGIMKEIVRDLSKKTDRAVISRRFHDAIAGIILETSLALSRKFKIKQVVLSGGVFQNKYLATRATGMLRANGLAAYTHSNVPTNDSGIPLGQIAIAAKRSTCA